MEMRPTRCRSQQHERSWLVTTCVVLIFCYALIPLGADAPPLPIASAAANTSVAPPNLFTLRSLVKKGQSAVAIFNKIGIQSTQVMAMYHAVRHVYDLQHLNVGQPYSIQFSPDGQLYAFTYDIDVQHRFEVRRRGKTFNGRIDLIPYKRSERVIAGRVTDTIYTALTAQGEPARLINDFADILAWSVDFTTDLRPGDTYRLLIEEHKRKGHAPLYYRILAAELVNRNQTLQAIYYKYGKEGGYYRPSGRSMRAMFLRSPLRYTRISSRFSYNRFHPILKRHQPHLGIDFAAPLGTPVRSIGSGKVIWAGNKGPNGKMIKIQHNEIYTSYYLHLSRFARGIKRGTRVRQGQIIGHVGSTGLSTGPHLDFRLAKNGTYINPLKQRGLEALPLPKKALFAFKKHAKRRLKKLSQKKILVGTVSE